MKPEDLNCVPDLRPRFAGETNGHRSSAEPLESSRLGLASLFAPAGQRSPEMAVMTIKVSAEQELAATRRPQPSHMARELHRHPTLAGMGSRSLTCVSEGTGARDRAAG
jgi:hypothetical protein